jgi:hypothetical protein
MTGVLVGGCRNPFRASDNLRGFEQRLTIRLGMMLVVAVGILLGGLAVTTSTSWAACRRQRPKRAEQTGLWRP